MNRVCAVCSMVVMGVFLVGVAGLQTGCEEAKGLTGLQVDPSSVMLSTNGASVVLSVVGGITNNTLALPLTWRVTDANLGQVTFSSGTTAVYRRSAANGVNTVIVEDQFENEGFATIRQQAASYSLALEADATTLALNEGTTIRITTEQAVAPFNWQLASGPGTVTGGSGSRSAVYAAGSQEGVAVISVSDANGASGSISITVREGGEDGTGDGDGDDDDPSIGI